MIQAATVTCGSRFCYTIGMQFLGVFSVLFAITLGVWIALSMIQNTARTQETATGIETYQDVVESADEAAAQLERR